MSQIEQPEGGQRQESSTDLALDKINQTVSAIADLTAKRRQQQAQQEIQSHQSCSWNSAQLEVLGRFFTLSERDYMPYDTSSAPLSAQKVRELILEGHYGGLDRLTSEMLKEGLTPKAWLDRRLMAICDNHSYFTWDQNKDILYCNMPDCACSLSFSRNSSCKLLDEQADNREEYELLHAGMLALLILDRLECEDEVDALFTSREKFQPFFDEVLATVSLIFSQGLNNLNLDMCEKVKALIVEAGSCRIEFLHNSLSVLLNMLKRFMDDSASASVEAIFNLLCRIVNTVEAIRKNDSREALISLYGINSGHSYYVQTMPVVGCGYNRVDTSTPTSGNCESIAYYFYDFIGRRFLAIYSVINDGFRPPQTLFSTDYSSYSLSAAAGEVLCFCGVWVCDGKIKNSKESWTDFDFIVDISKDEEENESKGSSEENDVAHRELYDLIAWRDYEALRRSSLRSSSEYFSVKGRTDNIHLVHVGKCLDIDKSDPEHVRAIFKDENGHKMDVLLREVNSSSKLLCDYMDKWKTSADAPGNFYALLCCPVVSGQMRPELVTFFCQPEAPEKTRKGK